jgi:hypothetical protein
MTGDEWRLMTRSLVVSGGVACNSLLRTELARIASAAGLQLVIPPPGLCTDNGAMIAWAGQEVQRLSLTAPVAFPTTLSPFRVQCFHSHMTHLNSMLLATMLVWMTHDGLTRTGSWILFCSRLHSIMLPPIQQHSVGCFKAKRQFLDKFPYC